MYYEHFGLTQAPFKITPNTDFFFTGGNRGPVLEALIYAITHGEGIVKVSGEVGSGKTMLCNMLQNRLPDNVESVYLANPSVGPDEVLHAIAFELQLGLDRNADRLEVMHALQDYLVQRHAEGKRVVVFIEESQSMPLATLEEIRLLSNLETRTDKLLQIVLFGQPELDETLRRPDIRQLRDRIAHSFRLEPLTHAQVREYLTFRMRAAGYRGPDIFSPRVVKQIADASNGLTRRINLIADKALLAAFSQNTHTLRTEHIKAALRDSEFTHSTHPWQVGPRLTWAGLALLAGTALGAILYAFFGARLSGEAIRPAAAYTQPRTEIARSTDPVVPSSAFSSGDPRAGTPGPEKVALATQSSLRGERSLMPVSAGPNEGGAASRDATDAESRRTSAPEPADIIAKRIDASKSWVKRASPEAYSIQLFVAGNEQHLRKHLKALPKFIDTNDIYMYRDLAQGGSRINVLWGSYDTRAAALDLLEELPPSLRVNRPYVRSLESIRADMDLSSAAN